MKMYRILKKWNYGNPSCPKRLIPDNTEDLSDVREDVVQSWIEMKIIEEV